MRTRAALVTGGSRGIGAQIVNRLAAAGARVAFTYRSDREAAEKVLSGLDQPGLAIRLDSAEPDAARLAVGEVMDRFGRLDVLVNNAGVYSAGPLDSVTIDEVDRVIALHVRAPYLFSQAAAAVMGPGGSIVTIGSSWADRMPYPQLALYAMSKAALLGMTRGLARELGPRDITVNVVHPGNIDTDMNPADSPEAAQELPSIALGRYGTVDDIAAMVTYLAGHSGRYITGTAVTVDGGYNA
jgi:3-oxoacyl-[acyl-carrier protein] reductase